MNLALFDLDNTILAGDSDYNWSRFLIQEGYLDGKSHAEKNEKFYADYKAGTLDIYAFVEFQFK
ncbi:MAG: HAD family hydrolase, partial [Candidatus Methylopumilus sp.]